MKAVVKQDIIVHITERGDTEIGKLPKGVGLERLRWDGTKVVDLADLDEIWVEHKNGAFILHAVEVPGSQLVKMHYRDRKRLTMDKGKIRLLTDEELQEKREREQALATIKKLSAETDHTKVDEEVDSIFPQFTKEQRAFLKKLYKAVVAQAKL